MPSAPCLLNAPGHATLPAGGEGLELARTTVDCPKCRAKFQIDDQWHDADCPACQAHMEIDVSESGTRKPGSGDAISDVHPGKQFAGGSLDG